MHILDAALLISLVAWITGVVPWWVILIPFGAMVLQEARKEDASEEP